jgi:hypothetical protein
MDLNNVVGYISLVISIGSLVLGIVNHRRIRSNCCGRVGIVSIDVEQSTPIIEKKPDVK